jgi:RNAse (barnase) inhibitor barstar
MSDDEPAGQLGDAPEAGVHRIERTEVEALCDAGRGAGLHCARLDLEACRSKADLLAALAQELRFPAWFGHNWDALADCLDDLEWLEAPGYLLVLENSEALSNAAPGDSAIALDILAEAAHRWRERGTPFGVFVVAKETK